jgi:hypothetical protein
MSSPGAAPVEGALVAIFDIEALSESLPEKQTEFVAGFLSLLSSHIAALSDLQPDRFLTGTGAIVQIGRSCAIDAVNTKRFLDFAVTFTTGLCAKGMTVRTALNYSEGDALAWAPENLPAGNIMNVAARTVAFCEPGEIMVTAEVRKLLVRYRLETEFPLQHNEVVTTRHGLRLDTYTYDPGDSPATGLYSPRAPSHPYKRFKGFPPIRTDKLQYFLSNGLENELLKVVSSAYDAIRQINDGSTFLSSSEVVQVLTRTNYDPDDKVLVVSRNDRSTGFWTQRRNEEYVKFLAGHAARNNGHINQTRIWVFDNSAEELMGDSILPDLELLHAPQTLFNFPAQLLTQYHHLSQLIFGVTLSTKHGYAIIPAPSADTIDSSRLRVEDIGDLLWQHRRYDDADGPMKAIITADSGFVAMLVQEFERLLLDANAVRLK